MSEELKPCPFCGGAAEGSLTKGGKLWWVYCSDSNDTCRVFPETHFCKSKEEAIRVWNTRTEDKK